MNKIKSAVQGAVATVGVLVMTVEAQAASLLPTGVFTGVQGNAVDTITDVMTYLVPLGVAVAVGKAVLGWSKGGTSKALR
jgi:hypothetical protein